MMRPALLSALVLVLLRGTSGCGGAPSRPTEVWLGRNARLSVDGSSVPINEAGPTRFEIPCRERVVVRISEPRKPVVTAALTTLVDPPAEVEDRLVFDSSANTLAVHTGGPRGMTFAGAGTQAAFEDPLALFRDDRGPYFPPHEGQGIIVAANVPDALVVVDGDSPRRAEASLARSARGCSLPAAIALAPGTHAVAVMKTGFRAFSTRLEVLEGEYVFLGVRLAEERAADGALGRGSP
jgi:hypothetical protein